LNGLEERASEATGQVENLESALVVCKEELQMVIEQLEETKDRYDKEIMAKSEEVRKNCAFLVIQPILEKLTLDFLVEFSLTIRT
jgi:hypothetical protein